MAPITGMRGTGDWGTDERPKNFREFILWADPNGQAPLTALMGKTRSVGTDDVEFAWWEEELKPIRLQLNGAVTTTQTALTVDGGDARDLVNGDLLLLEAASNGPVDEAYTNEIMMVSATPTSATAVTVVRNKNGTDVGIAQIADNLYLTKIGNAYEEGSTSPDTSTRNPTKFLNYAQIFKTAYEITRTAQQTRARTGPALNNDKHRKAFDHSVALEFAYLWGKKREDTTGTKTKWMTGGLLEFLAAKKAADTGAAHCVKVWTTGATEDELLDALYRMWDFRVGGQRGGNQRIGLAGNVYLNELNKLARKSSSTRVNFDGVVSTYGMRLQRWVFPQGEVFIRTHPLMNIHAGFESSCFYINPGALVDRTMQKTTPQDNIQPNDKDAKKGQWLTQSGPEFDYVKTMTFQGNFSAA